MGLVEMGCSTAVLHCPPGRCREEHKVRHQAEARFGRVSKWCCCNMPVLHRGAAQLSGSLD